MIRETCYRLIRKKPIDADSSSMDTCLSRCLSTFSLTVMGIGSMVGSGIYVLIGPALKNMAGPAVLLSFFMAMVLACGIALCFTEFATRFTHTGSVYLYTYYTFGELPAFLMGWSSLLGIIAGGAVNAQAWTDYLNFVTGNRISQFSMTYIAHWTGGPPLAEYPNFVAMFLLLILMVVAAFGAKVSSRFIGVFVFINLGILSFVIIVGFIYAEPANWNLPPLPANGSNTVQDHGGFMPFGWKGVMTATSACFWAFTGFEIIAVSVEEVKKPQESIPRATILTLAIVGIFYILTASALSLTSSYRDIDSHAPLPSAFAQHGLTLAEFVTSFGPLAAITSTLLNSLYGFQRIIFAMAADGLLPKAFSYVNPCSQVPVASVVVGGVIMSVISMLFDINDVLGFGIVLSLSQYMLVAAGIVVLRFQSPQEKEAVKIRRKLPSQGSIANDFSSTDTESSTTKEDIPKKEKELQTAAGGRGGGGGSQLPGCSFCLPVHITIMLFCDLAVLGVTVMLILPAFPAYTSWIGASIALLALLAIFLLLVHLMFNSNIDQMRVKVPCVPLIPSTTFFFCVCLLCSTGSLFDWLCYAVVNFVGLFVYFGYSMRHSHLEFDAVSPDVSMQRLLKRSPSQEPSDNK